MKRSINCLSANVKLSQQAKFSPLIRCMSLKEAEFRRNHLFTLEKKRQHASVGRIEKIEVLYKGIPNDCTLIMNKDISTPHDCAKHLGEWHVESSALALLDGTLYWDMHRPLTQSCTLELQNFNAPEPQQVNKAFWRTCSMMLGACATVAFKDEYEVKLHSFPGPDIRSGSFIYDIDIPQLPAWSPTDVELRSLSAEFIKLCRTSSPVERLEVSEELALEMFKDNQHKSEQIPSIAKAHGNITLYRIDGHVDISKGPLISNTSQIGRLAVASVHRITDSVANKSSKQLYRFQGVALPTGVILNHFAFSILLKRAQKLNTTRSPFNPFGDFPEVNEPRRVAA